MRYHEILPESSIIDLSQKRYDRDLQAYHTDMLSDIKTRMTQRSEQIKIAIENGIFSGFEIGQRFKSHKGNIYKITGFGLNPINSPKVEQRQRDFYAKQGWGDPLFVQFDDKLFQPIVYVESGDEKTGMFVDALRKVGYTTMTGPQGLK